MCTKMSAEEISKTLLKISDSKKMNFLIRYGNELTIMARGAYAFQSEEVANPKLLRWINEILHRVFQAISELERNSEEQFSLEGLPH